MKTVNEVSRITGVSVRTLHHYDAIGLLKPSAVTEAGYRMYDDDALAKLHSILMFRQLQFPLKDIKRIMENPGFDRREALRQQIEMLEIQKQQTERMIVLAREMIENGVDKMSFSEFNNSELEKYAEEVKERWGSTSAYKESEKKAEGRTNAESELIADGMMKIFARFGEIKDKDPKSQQAQELAKELQSYITENYYNCTKQIFASLGQMYVGDERFKANIDAAGGIGTAQFASDAIAYFTAK